MTVIEVNDLLVAAPVRPVKRIGILLGDLKKTNVSALKYLLLSLNTRQRLFEYEFLPCKDGDELLVELSKKGLVDKEVVRTKVSAFLKSQQEYLRAKNRSFELKENPPDYFVLVTLTRFKRNYYSLREGQLSIIALGNWKRSMAPPTILEFLLTLVLRESVSAISNNLRGSIHLGTKSCLFDFTFRLDEAKFKVLNAFICDYCRRALDAENLTNVADEVLAAMGKEWLGRSKNPQSPAGIVSKLGFNLFMTKGLEPSFLENCLAVLRKDTVKELLKLVATLLLAALVLILGLKGGAKE